MYYSILINAKYYRNCHCFMFVLVVMQKNNDGDQRGDSLDDSSDDCQQEGMSDEDSRPNPLALPCEKYLWGLLKGKEYSRGNVIVAEVKGRGRSAFAARDFSAGDFVCEYASCVRSPEDTWSEKRNNELGISSYCLDATFQGKVVTFDASPYVNDPGR